uniref:Uncharacterized protein n=1 Tax=Setaria italica TaxID=4555 RepID=K3XNM5_SETIT
MPEFVTLWDLVQNVQFTDHQVDENTWVDYFRLLTCNNSAYLLLTYREHFLLLTGNPSGVVMHKENKLLTVDKLASRIFCKGITELARQLDVYTV